MQSSYVGYVIGTKKYKEKDSIILILTSEGIKQIFGRSFRSVKSKYHSLNNLLLKVKILGKDSKTFLISDYDILDYSLVNKFDYDDFLNISRYINIIKLNENNNKKIYDIFEFIINDYDKKYKESYFVYLMANILKENGVYLNFKTCACGSQKDIVTFSFYDGGLVCKRCYSGQKIKGISEIKDINTIFNGKIKGVREMKIRLEIKKEIEALLNESLGLYIKE